MKAEDLRMILVSTPSKDIARELASSLLDRRLAACVQILPGIESHYVWKGNKESAEEFLLLIKTSSEKYAAVEQVVREQHPYEVPEIIALPISNAFAPVLCFRVAETTAQSSE